MGRHPNPKNIKKIKEIKKRFCNKCKKQILENSDYFEGRTKQIYVCIDCFMEEENE